MMTKRIEDILQFWFGAFPTPYTADASKVDMWFKNISADTHGCVDLQKEKSWLHIRYVFVA